MSRDDYRLVVALGVQACQSRLYWDRGISRYVREHALSLASAERSMVGSIWVDSDLPPPKRLADFCGTGLLRTNDRRAAVMPAELPDLFHMMSPLESLPLAALFPSPIARSGAKLAVTLYDLIPLRYESIYLADPTTRADFMARIRTIKQADLVLCISEATASDAAELLSIPPERLRVIYGGVSDAFGPSHDGQETAKAEIQSGTLGIRCPFILYTGGIDFRKNIDGLMRAFSELSGETRSAHQLVITCKANEQEKAALRSTAAKLGISDRLVVTGYVPDPVLKALYQTCSLFVFPSLAEGLGLPILEAMACGAPVVASDCSSMGEIVEIADARFDPRNPSAMARVIERGLSDQAFGLALRRYGAERVKHFTWREVARRTMDAYSSVVPVRNRSGSLSSRRVRRLAICTPYPPQRSGIAAYSRQFINALVARYPVEVDVVVDASPRRLDRPDSSAVQLLNWRSFALRHIDGFYDEVIYCIGNSDHHSWMYDLVRRIPGVLWVHDVRLSGLYQSLLRRTDNPRVRAELGAMFQRHRFGQYRSVSDLSLNEMHEDSAYFASALGRLGRRVLANSEFARDLLTFEIGGATPIDVLPFACPTVATKSDVDGEQRRALLVASSIPADALVLISVGIVFETKRPRDMIAALHLVRQSEPRARLVFVGECDRTYRQALEEMANRLGVGECVHFVGWVSDAQMRQWLWSADLALQLRYPTNGESSAAVADCLAHGLPTIVTAQGAAAELRGCTGQAPVDIAASDLAAMISALLAQPADRRALAQDGLEYARRHSFDYLATRFGEALGWHDREKTDNLCLGAAAGIAAVPRRVPVRSSVIGATRLNRSV